MTLYFQVLTSVLLAGLLSYLRVGVSSIVMVSNGRQGLLWVGVATQAGSLLGAVISFVCITEAKVFSKMHPCEE